MMMRELKYAKQSIDLFASIVWGLLSVTHFIGLILIMLNSRFGLGSILFFLMLLFISICGGALSVMYGTMYTGKRTYILLEDKQLIKDQGIIRPKKEISLVDVRSARKIGNQLRLSLGGRKELKVYLNCLTIEDIELIESKLDCFNIKV